VVAADLHGAAAASLVLLTVPAQALRDAARGLARVLRSGVPVIACAKGIERATGMWMTDVVAACLPACPAAILSGPSFALDVARDLPTAVTLAAADAGLAASLAAALGTSTFRVYHTDDVRGVEIGGATKNVLAIASGIVAGRGLGASAGAALVARSFAELGRFGLACGARQETLTGLSGLGDLVLTCNGPQSRNFALGHALGRGEPVAAALVRAGLAEGAFTAAILVALARARAVEMPIAASVNAILCGKINVDAAIGALLARPQKAET
jgi:glycerol-3-phosphate dehydrogenase (NAD(P)+)